MKHSEENVLASLRKKNDVRIDPDKKIIFVLNGLSNKARFKPQNDVGNKSWGKIDYLQKKKGYVLYRVAEFS